MWLAPNDTCRNSPLKVEIIDLVLSETVFDINIHPIRFCTTPEILQNNIARFSRGGIYKTKIQAEILQNPTERVSRGGIYKTKTQTEIL